MKKSLFKKISLLLCGTFLLTNIMGSSFVYANPTGSGTPVTSTSAASTPEGVVVIDEEKNKLEEEFKKLEKKYKILYQRLFKKYGIYEICSRYIEIKSYKRSKSIKEISREIDFILDFGKGTILMFDLWYSALSRFYHNNMAEFIEFRNSVNGSEPPNRSVYVPKCKSVSEQLNYVFELNERLDAFDEGYVSGSPEAYLEPVWGDCL